MKSLRSKLLMTSIALLAMSLFVMGCDTGGPTPGTTPVVNSTYTVGDQLAGGFNVSYVDSLGGYEATRDFDADDDNVIDEYQTLVSGRFGTDRTWASDRVYYLVDAVFIGNDNSNNCTLTIQAGTLIKGETSTTAPGLLVITRGSSIQAVGTSSNPIVFTSARTEGSRAPGDWGGLVINGNARINDGNTSGEAEGEGSTGTYGGSDDNDSSGTIQYVRVEFAGTLFTPDNELNGIAFQGVGRGTTIDHIQIHKNADDGIEFFGGSVNVSHVVITGAEDDSLDWTSGWTGSAQFVVLQQYAGLGDCGIEADSNSSDAAAAPVSNPTLANITFIGADKDGKVALQFRRGTDATLSNSIITGFPTVVSENSKSMDAGTITYNAVIADAGVVGTVASDWNSSSTVSLSGVLNLPAAALVGANTASVDVKPTAAPSATGISAADLTTAAADSNLKITATNYLGAVDPAASSLWYADWTATPAN